MALTPEEVLHIARLARLGLPEAEQSKMAQDLSSILEYVSELQQVDTSNVEYHYQVENLHTIVRDDVVEECDDQTRARILEAFPEKSGDLLKVKGVFE